MSLGTIPHLEQATVQAVAAPVAEAQAYVRTQPVAHLDETGWREARARAWLWVAVTAWVTVFAVRGSRGAKVVQDLLGERFCGILVTDRLECVHVVSDAVAPSLLGASAARL